MHERNDRDRLIRSEIPVTRGSRRPVFRTRAFVLPVIDVGKGLKAKVGCVVYRHNREHDCSMDHESPFSGAPPVEQRSHTLEEQNDDDP